MDAATRCSWPVLFAGGAGKHVVFGKVVEGLDVLERISNEAASPSGTPLVDVTIADCGLLPP